MSRYDLLRIKCDHSFVLLVLAIVMFFSLSWVYITTCTNSSISQFKGTVA